MISANGGLGGGSGGRIALSVSNPVDDTFQGYLSVDGGNGQTSGMHGM